MKTVFTNSQLAHVFVNQSQKSGRNSNGSMYFEGTEIYSYGSHYLLAQVHHIKGRKIIAVNVTGYSPTTSGHIRDVINAIAETDITFKCLYPNDLKRSLQVIHAEIAEEYFDYFNRIKPSWSDKFENDEYSVWDQFKSTVDEFNTHCDLFGYKKLKIKLTSLHKELWREKFEALKAREAELKTPEMIQKRELQRIKRAESLQAKQKTDLAKAVQLFRDGGETKSILREITPQLIRIRNNQVETSRGAHVPLNEAIELYKKIKRNKVKEGEKVGHFTFDRYSQGIITIGCHQFAIEEVDAVLSNGLKLIQGGAQ